MLHRGQIKHCKACGVAVEYRLPDDGDTRVRAVCPACHTVHYENPLNVVGTIPIWGDKVDRKSTRLNSSHMSESRMPSSA